MPELPDVEVFRRYAQATSLHQRIRRADVYDTKLVKGTSPGHISGSLKGASLVQTDRHGKHLGLQVEQDGWLVLHFGMTGRLEYYQRRRARPEYTSLLLRFDNGCHLAYLNRRRLGRIRLVPDFGALIEQQGLGPDAQALSARDFGALIRSHRGGIKALLMNQAAIAGLGNVYVDETLYQCGVYPGTPAKRLKGKQVQRLYKTMRRVLRTAIDRKADPTALPKSWLLPHRDRKGECPKGHGRFKTMQAAGRTTYYCPRCQPAGR